MRTLLALALVAAAVPAAANTLYKSVDSTGTVMFSDTPPPEGARILEERVIGAPSSSYALAAPDGSSQINGLEQAFALIDADAALAAANARVDMAERALAQARGVAPRTEGLRLPRLTPVSSVSNAANSDHVEFCKRDLKIARQALMDVLRARQLASGRQPKG